MNENENKQEQIQTEERKIISNGYTDAIWLEEQPCPHCEHCSLGWTLDDYELGRRIARCYTCGYVSDDDENYDNEE